VLVLLVLIALTVRQPAVARQMAQELAAARQIGTHLQQRQTVEIRLMGAIHQQAEQVAD
jgi:hypothetical protein